MITISVQLTSHTTKGQFCWHSTADSELRTPRLFQQYSSVVVVQQLLSDSEARSCRAVCRQQAVVVKTVGLEYFVRFLDICDEGFWAHDGALRDSAVDADRV